MTITRARDVFIKVFFVVSNTQQCVIVYKQKSMSHGNNSDNCFPFQQDYAMMSRVNSQIAIREFFVI